MTITTNHIHNTLYQIEYQKSPKDFQERLPINAVLPNTLTRTHWTSSAAIDAIALEALCLATMMPVNNNNLTPRQQAMKKEEERKKLEEAAAKQRLEEEKAKAEAERKKKKEEEEKRKKEAEKAARNATAGGATGAPRNTGVG